ncbi:C40 family peptidase [Enterocloster aldenensis]|uniref:C40 family peptidase n=1 Tax=Enterocloster clostridioformis TaxID=1531 RepID=A0ABD6LFI3_9FIRM|nr:C40 family peptidase [Enterocloster clostridioformis]NSJ43393.1 C40 family peptidase [Enterocloster clostridioformis]
MKRKLNKPQQEPRERPGSWEEPADPGGASSGAGTEGTSGQSVHKSKFRQKSKQEQAAASKLRMEKRGDKLVAAKGKLAKQKPPKKPGPVRRVGRAAGGTVHGFVHGKIYENEQENVGIEGAHRSELVGEALGRKGVRFAKKTLREHPAKAVQRAESKYVKATADYHFRMAAQEHPEMSGNPVSRMWRKRRLKKQYQKRAREAVKAGAKVAGFVKRHPVGVLLALACVLLLFMMQSCSSSLVTLGNAGAGAVGATTYPSQDEEMLAAEAAYVGMEAELADYLDSYESTHDYDEYHFDLDSIEHDPYVLISILSVLHEGAWTLDQVQGTLETLFDRQYILTEDVVVEVRYRTDSEGNSYDVEVPYNYYICYVTLENRNLSHLPLEMMNEEQMSRYSLYMSTLGNRPDLFPESAYVGKYVTNPPAGYDVPGEYLDDETFAAMLTEAEKYLGYPYVWGGSSPATSFDCSGFVSWVINHSGWNVGRLGAQGLYNICTPTSSPKPGDLVFFVGTYDTAGVSHCGIYVGDGMMIHCGDPIQYANLNTSYWQSHFYAYGRLP